ncbi:MAG: hypothetical protein ACRDOK_24025 [Streptosporangiaceae bacterium]
MGIPQVPDQVRKAPTLALRSFFAGIGKILLAADRPQASPSPTGPRHAAPGRRTPRTAGAASQPSDRRRSLDETGNVRLLAAEELTGCAVFAPDGTRPGPETKGEPGMRPATVIPVATQPLSGNVPVGASLVVHEVPVPGFETMSVAAIRARLRTLDVDQLQALLVHEHKSTARPEIIAMIERRIEKIESGG